MLCFNRYHPAYCTSVASSSLSLVVNGWLMMLTLMDDDMVMEVQTINLIRHKISRCFIIDSLIRLVKRYFFVTCVNKASYVQPDRRTDGTMRHILENIDSI